MTRTTLELEDLGRCGKDGLMDEEMGPDRNTEFSFLDRNETLTVRESEDGHVPVSAHDRVAPQGMTLQFGNGTVREPHLAVPDPEREDLVQRWFTLNSMPGLTQPEHRSAGNQCGGRSRFCVINSRIGCGTDLPSLKSGARGVN